MAAIRADAFGIGKDNIKMKSKAAAIRLGAFVKPMDPYALVAVSGACVKVYTARSQAPKAMGRKVFQESKDAVLEVLAGMIEVSKEQLLKFDGQGTREGQKPSARAA
jgi:hypothetical protein